MKRAEVLPDRVLQDAAEAFEFSGQLIKDIEFAGVHVAVTVEAVHEEHQRRRAVRLGPVLDRDLWGLLASLPYREPVPWMAIDPVAASVLDAIPSGIVTTHSSTVERIIRPAVRVTGVLTTDTRWRQGIDRVSRFSAHGPRGTVVTGSIPKAAIEWARKLGIGLATPSEESVLLRVDPRTTMPTPGSRHFRFLEVVYKAWLRMESRRTVPTR